MPPWSELVVCEVVVPAFDIAPGAGWVWARAAVPHISVAAKAAVMRRFMSLFSLFAQSAP
jgi:hypothetical protein